MNNFTINMKGLILLVALISLGLSIAAMATSCHDSFGDVNLKGKRGLMEDGQPCEPMTYDLMGICSRMGNQEYMCKNRCVPFPGSDEHGTCENKPQQHCLDLLHPHSSPPPPPSHKSTTSGHTSPSPPSPPTPTPPPSPPAPTPPPSPPAPTPSSTHHTNLTPLWITLGVLGTLSVVMMLFRRY